ncbi:MAG: hypothetical protein O7I42_17775 [Alphaproteobacteria bacterium]|nr:hypothetical protein [Alphaproteobacteria bacterium]
MLEYDAQQRRMLIVSGIVAIVGALITGIGEFTFQFSPRGGYEGSEYLYFLDVSPARLTWGHFISVLAAPLYLVGYWHIAQMLRPVGRWLSTAVFGFGVYAFVIGDVWLGGRVNLALTVQAREAASDAVKPLFSTLLVELSAHNEPLINVVRVLVLIVSLLLIYGIVSGRSPYPRWLVAFTPIVVLIAVFLLYAMAPVLGVYVLPAAMNIAHVVFFAFSTWAATKIQVAGQ